MSFIRDFDTICDSLDLDEDYIIKNINQILSTYKQNTRDICELLLLLLLLELVKKIIMILILFRNLI